MLQLSLQEAPWSRVILKRLTRDRSRAMSARVVGVTAAEKDGRNHGGDADEEECQTSVPQWTLPLG